MPTIADSGISNWKPDRLSDLTGKTYLITGGNSGIGLEAAKILGTNGGDIIIACRNAAKGESAVEEIRKTAKGSVAQLTLDLADLSSVRAAAEDAKNRFGAITALINNAGIMQTPPQQTADGFEMQLGTNHLGHFLWSGLMFDAVDPECGRIVTVSSIAHKFGRIDFDNLMLETGYSPSTAYFQSKLANILFAFELDRRLRAKGSAIKSVACHPGYSNTNLQSTGPQGFLNFIYKFTNALMAQSSQKGSYPTVLAAAGEEALAGAYYGPTGWGDAAGPVGDAGVAHRALDEKKAALLWERSERLVGFEWDMLR